MFGLKLRVCLCLVRKSKARQTTNKLRAIELAGITDKNLDAALCTPVTVLDGHARGEADWFQLQFDGTAISSVVPVGETLAPLLLRAAVRLALPVRAIDAGLRALRRQAEQLAADVDLAVQHLRPARLGAYSDRRAASLDFFSLRLNASSMLFHLFYSFVS